jgi:heptosyltransferase III
MQLPLKNINRILCIKPRGIGDIILSTIILENLSKFYPSAEIHYLVESFAKDSIIHHPLVSKVISMQKTEFSLKVALRLRKEKYDLILDLWSNPRSAQITFLTAAKYRAGFSYRGRRYAYNILATSERGNYHSAEHNLKIIEALNIPIHSKKVNYYISESDNLYGLEFIKNNFNALPVFTIIPAGGWDSKRCDKEKWVSICESILLNYKVNFLILWGPGDETDADFIKSHLKEKAVLAPPTDLNKMAALIKNSNLVLANDSGPMHISAALGIPTIGIFGPTNPLAHGPYSPDSTFVYKSDLPCITCNLLKCPYNHECMFDLPNEEIVSAISSVLKTG